MIQEPEDSTAKSLSSHRPSVCTHLYKRCPGAVMLAKDNLKYVPMEVGLPNGNSSFWHSAQEPETCKSPIQDVLWFIFKLLNFSRFPKKITWVWLYSLIICLQFLLHQSLLFNPMAKCQVLKSQRWLYSPSCSKNWQQDEEGNQNQCCNWKKNRQNSAARNTVSNWLTDQHTYKSRI